MTTAGLFDGRRPEGRSEWCLVYEVFTDKQPGDIITHEQLLDMLERDRGQMNAVYRAVARAAKELRRCRSRSVAAVPGVGYRMLHANEHERQAEQYRRKSIRNMRTELEVRQSTDLTQLSAAERRQAMAAALVVENLIYTVESVAKRQEMMDRALTAVIAHSAEMERRVTLLEGRTEEK